MKLLSFIGWATVLTPFAIILAKLLGWITWSWIWTLFVALTIPILVFILFLALAVYVISQTYREEWEQS